MTVRLCVVVTTMDGNTLDHHLESEVCQDITAPVVYIIRTTCIRSAPRAVEWEGLATGVQWTVSRPSVLNARRLTRLTVANEVVPGESSGQLRRGQ